MTEHTRTIEIHGQKFEVDTRELQKIDRYKIGDRVKLLRNGYDGWKVFTGVLVAFDNFKNLPTATVCYLDGAYQPELLFAHINEESKSVEIAPCGDEQLPIEKGRVIDRLEAEINKKRAEIDDLHAKIYFFKQQFGRYFPECAQDASS